MSVQDGQPVNQAYTNTRMASKQDNNVYEGVQSLTHNNAISGADVLNVQKTVNDILTAMASIGVINNVDLISDQTADGIKTWIKNAFFQSDVQVSGKLTVLNDLEIQGTTTTVNTTELEVLDALVTVNSGGTDGSAENSGLEIERPSGNASIKFDATLDNKFKLGLDTDLREVATVFKDTKANLDALAAKPTSALYYTTDLNAHYLSNGTSLYPIENLQLSKGSIITSDGATNIEQAVGVDGLFLQSDSSKTNGLAWVAAQSQTVFDTKANIDALTREVSKYYYATDEDILYLDNGATLIAIGGPGLSSGGGGGMTPVSNINIISNGSTTIPASNWAEITITQIDVPGTAAVKITVGPGDTIQAIKDATSGRVLVGGNTIIEHNTSEFAITGVVFS